MFAFIVAACASANVYGENKPSRVGNNLPGLEVYESEGTASPGKPAKLNKAAIPPKKQKDNKPAKLALAKGQNDDGTANSFKLDQTSPLGARKFEWKDGDKSSLMKESSYFQKKFELPDVLSGKKAILADKPVLQFDKSYDTKKASGFDDVYETKKSNLSKDWTGGKASNFEMKESNLKGQAHGFDKSVRGKDYYGPIVEKLDSMEGPNGNSGGVDGHRLFPDEPITVGQVRELLKNGNPANKSQQVLKAKPANDKPVDSVAEAKPERRQKVPVFLPTQEEQEKMKLEKERQAALEAQRLADAEAGDVPSSMQRDVKPLLVVPIPEDEQALAETPQTPAAPVFNPGKRPAFAPAVDPYAEKAPNPEDDFIPGEVPALPSAPANKKQAPATTPAPAAPQMETPADSVPHPGLPGRLGRNQPNSPAPVSQPRVTPQNPMADTQMQTLSPTPAAPSPRPALQQAESEPAAPLQDLMKPATNGRPAYIQTTTSALTNPAPASSTRKLNSSLPVVEIPGDVDVPMPVAPAAAVVPAPARATPLPRAVDAKRAKPATERPSASNKPAVPARTSSTSTAPTAARVAKATPVSESTR